jgi:hypothetical protein
MKWILISRVTIMLLYLFLIPQSLAFFIEGTYNLSAADISKLKPKVGMFTPYELTPGGGERYFLSVATTFFDMGYSVELLLKEENVCGTRECLG